MCFNNVVVIVIELKEQKIELFEKQKVKKMIYILEMSRKKRKYFYLFKVTTKKENFLLYYVIVIVKKKIDKTKDEKIKNIILWKI